MKWQPIETAPKDGSSIDLWVTINHDDCHDWTGRFADCYWSGQGNLAADWMHEDGFIRDCGVSQITHWMPLPEPPK